jgi:hypothetical protein
MSAPQITLKGAPGSPYTRKMLSVLRYRRMAYRYIISGTPTPDLPQPKVELLPTFFLPGADGQMEAVVDSTPLIRRLEPMGEGRSILPPNPVVAFLDELLEDYGDEWLTKAMFHFRWAYPADIHKASQVLPRWRKITASEEAIAPQSKMFADRQIGRLYVVGSNTVTGPVIEASYDRFLEALNDHLTRYPFLMGHRPAASDFAVFGQLTQLAGFDPTPSAITLARSPRVYTWVDLVEDLSGLEPTEDQWASASDLATSLRPLFVEMGRTYVPVMLANAKALMTGADKVECEVEGLPWVQQPFPYQGKCVQWLRQSFASLSATDQGQVRDILAGTGCEPLLG